MTDIDLTAYRLKVCRELGHTWEVVRSWREGDVIHEDCHCTLCDTNGHWLLDPRTALTISATYTYKKQK